MTVSSIASDKPSGFTEDERREIITRLQVVENIASGVSAQLAILQQELFPEAEVAEGEPPRNVNMVREIHAFCVRLSAVLDAMGSNPMFAAMMPPEVAAQMQGE